MLARSTSGASSSSFFLRYWRGEGALWRIFWVYGVLASTVLSGLYAWALFAADTTAQQILLPIILLYTAWIVVSVWRCAPNAGSETYALLARGLTIAWALNVLLVIAALQLGLIAIYTGAPAG
ncbi:MAG: hypothetical protein ACFCUW_07325 [Kiloniellaceae bacterium]